jgi:RNA polymerase sigma factor (sigma-70 family)
MAVEEIAAGDSAMIVKARRRGAGVKALAQRLGRTRAAVYGVIMEERRDRLFKRKARFHDDPLYHDEDAAGVIDSLVAQESLADEPGREELRVPKDLPPYLQDLYRTPLLTPARERALFLKLNFQKFRFAQARRGVEPERVRNRDLSELEALLAEAQETKKQIVQANLRLVVSVARKHVRPGINLLDLVSDGNLTLMRAVDGFDVNRGNRFSTYATLALMKGFARSVPQMRKAGQREMASIEALSGVADVRHERVARRLVQRDEVRQLLSRLDERERRVLGAYFGLDGDSAAPATYEQVGRRLGLSKERVRQIERGAMAKLRAAAGLDESSQPAGR